MQLRDSVDSSWAFLKSLTFRVDIKNLWNRFHMHVNWFCGASWCTDGFSSTLVGRSFQHLMKRKERKKLENYLLIVFSWLLKSQCRSESYCIIHPIALKWLECTLVAFWVHESAVKLHHTLLMQRRSCSRCIKSPASSEFFFLDFRGQVKGETI